MTPAPPPFAPPRPSAEPGAPLLPPRPNTGPVPWADEAVAPGPWPSILVALLAVTLLGLALAWARRRRARRGAGPPAQTEPADLEALDAPSRHLAAAEILRAALAARHGPAYRARTTEEILADPALLASVGPDRLRLVGSILAAADRIKFSGPLAPTTADDGPTAELVSSLRAALLGREQTPQGTATG